MSDEKKQRPMVVAMRAAGLSEEQIAAVYAEQNKPLVAMAEKARSHAGWIVEVIPAFGGEDWIKVIIPRSGGLCFFPARGDQPDHWIIDANTNRPDEAPALPERAAIVHAAYLALVAS